MNIPVTPIGLRDPAHLAEVQAKLMLIVLCFIWGTTWPVMKLALNEIPPLSMRTMSAGFGALTLYLICVVRRRSLRVPTAKAWVHVVMASLLNVVGFSLLSAFAQILAATSRVAILAYTIPIWSVLLAWPVLGERPSRIQTTALGLCAAGIAILIYPLASSGIPLGLILALASGAIWAAGTVYLKWARIPADPMGVATWQTTIAFLVIGTCMLVFEGGPRFGAAHATALFANVFTGIVGNGFAYGLWFTIVGRLNTATASLGIISVPVIGIVASMLILGETPTGADICGFALIFAASACALFGRAPPPMIAAAAT